MRQAVTNARRYLCSFLQELELRLASDSPINATSSIRNINLQAPKPMLSPFLTLLSSASLERSALALVTGSPRRRQLKGLSLTATRVRVQTCYAKADRRASQGLPSQSWRW